MTCNTLLRTRGLYNCNVVDCIAIGLVGRRVLTAAVGKSRGADTLALKGVRVIVSPPEVSLAGFFVNVELRSAVVYVGIIAVNIPAVGIPVLRGHLMSVITEGSVIRRVQTLAPGFRAVVRNILFIFTAQVLVAVDIVYVLTYGFTIAIIAVLHGVGEDLLMLDVSSAFIIIVRFGIVTSAVPANKLGAVLRALILVVVIRPGATGSERDLILILTGLLVVTELPGLIAVGLTLVLGLQPILSVADLEGAGGIGHSAGHEVSIVAEMLVVSANRILIASHCILDPHLAELTTHIARTVVKGDEAAVAAGTAAQDGIAAARAAQLGQIDALLFVLFVIIDRIAASRITVLALFRDGHAVLTGIAQELRLKGHVVVFLDLHVFEVRYQGLAYVDGHRMIDGAGTIIGIMDVVVAVGQTQVARLAGAHGNVHLAAVLLVVVRILRMRVVREIIVRPALLAAGAAAPHDRAAAFAAVLGQIDAPLLVRIVMTVLITVLQVTVLTFFRYGQTVRAGIPAEHEATLHVMVFLRSFERDLLHVGGTDSDDHRMMLGAGAVLGIENVTDRFGDAQVARFTGMYDHTHLTALIIRKGLLIVRVVRHIIHDLTVATARTSVQRDRTAAHAAQLGQVDVLLVISTVIVEVALIARLAAALARKGHVNAILTGGAFSTHQRIFLNPRVILLDLTSVPLSQDLVTVAHRSLVVPGQRTVFNVPHAVGDHDVAQGTLAAVGKLFMDHFAILLIIPIVPDVGTSGIPTGLAAACAGGEHELAAARAAQLGQVDTLLLVYLVMIDRIVAHIAAAGLTLVDHQHAVRAGGSFPADQRILGLDLVRLSRLRILTLCDQRLADAQGL